MSDSDYDLVTLLLSVDEARLLSRLRGGTYLDGPSADALREKASSALDAHERERRKRDLGLPWGAYPEASDPELTRKWKVCSTGQRADGARCTERMLGMLTEAQARLAAAAPELAKLLEDATRLRCDPKDKRVGDWYDEAVSALHRARWSDER